MYKAVYYSSWIQRAKSLLRDSHPDRERTKGVQPGNVPFQTLKYSFFVGNYTCEVEWSPEKPPVTLSHYLEVCVPPSVMAINTEGGSFVDVKEGDNATLECEADGIPRPEINWVSTNHYFHQSEENICS